MRISRMKAWCYIARRFIKYNFDLIEHKVRYLHCGLFRIRGARFSSLLLHDISKLSRDEYWTRFRRWYLLRGVFLDRAVWQRALEHHFRHNAHHFEHHIVNGRPTAMLYEHVVEMVIDWTVVSEKKRDELSRWLREEFPKMKLHFTSVVLLTVVLEKRGIRSEDWLPEPVHVRIRRYRRYRPDLISNFSR